MAIKSVPADQHLSPARKKELLCSLDSLFLQRIQDLLDLFFDEAEFRLFSAAQHAPSNQQQAQLLETLTQFKRNRQTLEAGVLGNLQNNTAPTHAQSRTGQNVAELTLIEHDVFEAQLVLETITRKADQRWFEPLYCLTKRYSLLSDVELDAHDLSIGIIAISRSIHSALQTQVPLTLLPLVLHAFDCTVLQHIGEIYDVLNTRLKQWAVLPNLEIDLWRELHQGKIGARNRHQSLPRRDFTQTSAPPVSVSQVTAAPAEIASDELFGTVQKILQLMRQSPGSDATGNDDREAVLGILAILQQQTNDNSIPLLQRLHDYAASNETSTPDNASTDSLRFVDNLFTEFETALRNSPALTESLRQLQIPLARATVQQPDLLGDSAHPVHQFIRLLSSLTANADLPNAPLEHKLSDVITPLLGNPVNALSSPTDSQKLFSSANSDLAPLLAQQDKARERNIRRIVDTYQGQQQLAHAHAAVDRELQRRNANTQTPALALQLLDQGWRHILTLTYMRHGDNSAEWSEHFAVFDELLWRLGSGSSETAIDDTSTTLQRSEANQLADRIGHHLDNFFPGEYRNAVLVDAIRNTLLGETAVETVTTPWQQRKPALNPRELQLELDQAYPNLVRWFRRARDFKADDEFVHFKDPALRERYTLVWIGKNQQHFVFVNARGHKVFDFDLVDLANEMAKGLHPVGNQTEWAAVNQVMLGTANNAYQQLVFNSTHDELTGLLNRKEFEHQLGNALLEAKNQQLQHALLYIDIDQFSLINNLLGHVTGDNVLKHVSRLLAENSPSSALLARTGGNEFAVLIIECDSMQAHTSAENICRAIGNHAYTTDNHKLNITVSIGVIAITKYSDGTVTLLRDAVAAANTAKELGRNRIYLLQSDVELHSRREKLLTWIDKMSDLLDNDYLVLRAQPIRSIVGSNSVDHYEILLGLRDADGIVTPPGEFIEAAECYNRMQRVDRWVIEHAFAWMATIAAQQLQIPQLSINLSGNSLNDATFLDFLIDQFGHYRVAPNAICFEITETATIKNLTNAVDFIHQVKKIGCSFALDDFGTGLSSYEYLKHLPVDYLKIDGMFIVDIHKNPNDYAMVKSINEIAHFMGKKTIAEFVESATSLESLHEIGIDFVQGFHIGQPALLSEIALKSRS